MKGLYTWYAIALLIVSTSVNYWLVLDGLRNNANSSSSSVIRSGAYHK